MMTTRVIAIALVLGGALAGCKKTPPDCTKLKDTFCGENGTPDECEIAKKAADTKDANVCHSRWTELFQKRKSDQAAEAAVQRKNAMKDEIAARGDLLDKMDKIQGEINDLTTKLQAAKGADKKAIQAQIDDANKRMMDINAQLQARVNGPDGGK
jgi:hypothetical protein